MSNSLTCQTLKSQQVGGSLLQTSPPKVFGTGVRLWVGRRWFLLETPLSWHVTIMPNNTCVPPA